MGSLNKVMLIGRLGSDIEKRVTQSGSSVATLSLATTDTYKDQQGNRQEKTEWHRVVLWNRLADLAEQYLSKGKQVYIEGSLRTNEWTDKDGNKRYTTEVSGQTLQFIDSSSNPTSQNSPQNYSQKGPYYEENNRNARNAVGRGSFPQSNNMGVSAQHKDDIDDEFIEDDIPF
jgi:single-strand DNA-binding protein